MHVCVNDISALTVAGLRVIERSDSSCEFLAGFRSGGKAYPVKADSSGRSLVRRGTRFYYLYWSKNTSTDAEAASSA